MVGQLAHLWMRYNWRPWPDALERLGPAGDLQLDLSPREIDDCYKALKRFAEASSSSGISMQRASERMARIREPQNER